MPPTWIYLKTLLDFNSIKVQLKQEKEDGSYHEYTNFNSIKVQLKPSRVTER